jgi:hypothetical protein
MAKQPTIRDLVKANETSLGVLMRSVDRHHTAIGRISEKVDRVLVLPDQAFTPEQFEQLRMAVNKIAAYAAAMDETKKTMIKLTSERIAKLEARVAKLRVRMKRLEG